jgi:hypothetical protein
MHHKWKTDMTPEGAWKIDVITLRGTPTRPQPMVIRDATNPIVMPQY